MASRTFVHGTLAMGLFPPAFPCYFPRRYPYSCVFTNQYVMHIHELFSIFLDLSDPFSPSSHRATGAPSLCGLNEPNPLSDAYFQRTPIQWLPLPLEDQLFPNMSLLNSSLFILPFPGVLSLSPPGREVIESYVEDFRNAPLPPPLVSP